ncbi:MULTISPECIES: hypothetical protein [unclassified Paenibacillus]|nr:MULTISPECIES: hypothetical protein [unclassified Paenibacillus]
MIIRVLSYKRRVSAVLAMLLLSGCTVSGGKPAAEELNLALAGMDGKDAVTFEGSAALLIAGKPVPESALYYGGKVQDHNRISLYSLLPDEAGEIRTASEEGSMEKLGGSKASTPALYTKLEKKNGEWQPQQSGEAGRLAGLNPLQQLEELQKPDTQVTEESGSSGGTRVLRIRLSPDAAKRQLSEELEREMQAIRQESDAESAGQTAEVKEAMNALWTQKSKELEQRIDEAEVTSVYFMKVDTRHSLPKRLTWTRTIRYPGMRDPAAGEAYVTKVDFYGYQ